jgi:hypothetical protein
MPAGQLAGDGDLPDDGRLGRVLEKVTGTSPGDKDGTGF